MSEHPSPNPEPDPASSVRGSAAPPLRFAYRLARIFLIVALILMVVRLSGCAESLAYFPSREAFENPPGVEDVSFESADGTRLHGWFMAGAGADAEHPGPAILHVHGNAGNVSSHESFSSFFPGRGFSVFLFDYRGYGRSDDEGPLRRADLLRDTQAALAVLEARPEVDPDRIGVYGVSLGGAFALHAAAGDPSVRAVATVSAFSTWPGAANDLAPVLGAILMRPGLDPEDGAAALGGRPYLILHGLADEIVNSRHAERLAKAARGAGVDVTVWTDPTGDHNTMVQTNAAAREQLIGFFTEHLAPN
ncbi:MAG: alpha/beta fold hydrolase [Phycisphaerales bacterium]|nr:alpha/beta fold hydrolase [Phycisphaerales bacterium]